MILPVACMALIRQPHPVNHLSSKRVAGLAPPHPSQSPQAVLLPPSLSSVTYQVLPLDVLKEPLVEAVEAEEAPCRSERDQCCKPLATGLGVVPRGTINTSSIAARTSFSVAMRQEIYIADEESFANVPGWSFRRRPSDSWHLQRYASWIRSNQSLPRPRRAPRIAAYLTSSS